MLGWAKIRHASTLLRMSLTGHKSSGPWGSEMAGNPGDTMIFRRMDHCLFFATRAGDDNLGFENDMTMISFTGYLGIFSYPCCDFLIVVDFSHLCIHMEKSLRPR